MNPIAAAVAPLRLDAIRCAEQKARFIVEHVKKRAAAGTYAVCLPFDVVARMNSGEYADYKRRQATYSQLTTDNVFNDEKITRYIQRAGEDAAAQYDAFVLKLCHKIGACDRATLEGNHVWGHSVLTIMKGNVIERWKTQQITNTSKLGNIFNQWPTRRME